MDEEYISGLFYGFLFALGIILLSTPSPGSILTAPWIGTFLVLIGIIGGIFILMEKNSTSDEYQGILTIILLFIIVGLVIASYGADISRIIGAISLSVALGRALALVISALT